MAHKEETMPAHAKYLRTLGLQPTANILALNLIAGSDIAAFAFLASFGNIVSSDRFCGIMKLLDGYHIYGPEISRLITTNELKNPLRFIEFLTDGDAQCSHCSLYARSKDVYEMVKSLDESAQALAEKLPAVFHQSTEAAIFYNSIQLDRSRQQKGSREFFAERFGEVVAPPELLANLRIPF